MARVQRASLLLLALAVVASGCVGPASSGPGSGSPTDGKPVGWSDTFVNPVIVEHDHTDFSQHVLANNVEKIGHSYLDPAGGNMTPGGLGEIDVVNNYAYVAVFGRGFAIVDLTDPANPKLVSLTDTPTPVALPVVGKYTADLKVDSTGDWVFLGMELSEYPGVLIYDATDKAAPKLAGFWPAPGTLAGCHMVEYAVIDEVEYVFCAPLDNAIWIGRLLPPTPAGREIATVARWIPTTPKFVQQQANAIQNDPVNYGPSLVSGHQDMTYQLDPLDGTPTLFVSFWNLGMRIVDVSNPLLPTERGSWAGEDGAKWRGNLHTTVAANLGERRIIVTIPEGTDPPALFVLDATNLDAPELLAEWTALDDFKGEAGTFSLHNFQIVDGKVYIAMGHGGLWCLDISTPELQAAPKPVASYLPHEPAGNGEPYQGYYWDSVLWGGYWLTADASGGFYVLHKLDDPAGDPNYNSFA